MGKAISIAIAIVFAAMVVAAVFGGQLAVAYV
jgi:Na+(H+)/acetate symporter ActP